MTRKVRSAKGEVVDFDLLAITRSLATAPATINVEARRKFIDEKEGIKVIKGVPLTQAELSESTEEVPDALKLAFDAVEKSSSASKKLKPVIEKDET
jgi:hypothetical protein